MIDCRDCKRWQSCRGKGHYKYSDIRFCPHQIMWILEQADVLLDGAWPVDVALESFGQRGIAHEATFEKPEIVLGEVEKRMESTGPVGECLRHAAESQKGIWELAGPEYNVLMYLKGKKRKLQSYAQWRRGVR